MPKTRQDIVEQSLKHLGVTTGNETPSAEDFDLMDSMFEPVLADLNARQIVYDLSPSAIQDEHFIHLSFILAKNGIPAFGVEGDDAQKLMALALDAENKLFSIARTKRRGPRRLGVDTGLRAASIRTYGYTGDA